MNDLYAILKPVIKPHIYDPNMIFELSNGKINMDFNMLFMGNLRIPYDTLSNASKLNSIRKNIEYFLFQDKTENYQNVFVENHKSPQVINQHRTSANTLVNFQITAESINIINKSNKTGQGAFFQSNLTNANRKFNSTVVYAKNRIGFCGKIKENCQFFVVIILSEVSSASNDSNSIEEKQEETIEKSKIYIFYLRV